MELRSGYYRVSVKALIFDETKTKFLFVKDQSGIWELPGGGLDWGESAADGIAREIREEMGLEVTYVATQPSYFVTAERYTDKLWTANVIYEATVKDLHFISSPECLEIIFVTKQEAQNLNISYPAERFLAVFSPN